ncbi:MULTISPECIES: hypothetical protein [Vibrio harveyi group]|uniref:hypothetical protein n=1 Tax=Vibrio harveyi group TaxID=717610 RepID=UPI00084B3EB6|nr:hypothetical protein [Vibrio parahaemolyticus]HAT8551727.1 hypothetical protein [Vibrio vulnificus]EHR6177204.1 hypothetical protein [Vibrio parahaemolyticus]MDF5205756.1 hypothetical protein [Vibrio parahaemolyticus]MDF5215676.1 hypothetical protein [Vibrio parahaemolyticus]ODY28037.1 hypothetical protein BBM21_15285 [Vibrio parahaemolyticus]
MDYEDDIDNSIAEIPQDKIIKTLVDLSLNLYRWYLDSEKKEQFCLLLTDCNNEEIIHLCYRADVNYFSYFESLRDVLITKCHARGVSIALNEMPVGKELLPYGEVETSRYVSVFSEERQKLSLKVAQIERIELHPLIQRKRIFTQIVEGLLAMEDIQSVIVTNIYNNSWFYHLKKTATETAVLPCSRAALFSPSSNN